MPVCKNLPVILVLFSIFNFLGKPQTLATEVDSIFFHIYNQEFEKASNELFNAKHQLKSIEYELLSTDLFWWKAILSNTEKDYKILESILSNKISTSEKLSKENKFAELIYLNYMVRLMAVTDQSLKMVKYFIRLNLLMEARDYPNLTIEEQQVYEIYKAVFRIGKSNVFFVKPNENNNNIQVLKKHSESSTLINKTISCYFLAKIYSELIKSPEQSVLYYSKLCFLYPANSVFKTELKAEKSKTKNSN